MLVTAENTRNDVQRPLNYEKPPKIRRFSYQSATVGLPIVNQSYHADGRALWVTKKMERQEVETVQFHEYFDFFNFERLYHYLRSKSFPTHYLKSSHSPLCGLGPTFSARRAISCSLGHPFASLFICKFGILEFSKYILRFVNKISKL